MSQTFDEPIAGAIGIRTFRLIYRSRSRLAGDSRAGQLGEILRQSRANNAKLGVTGALLMSDAWFAQVLEGGEGTVRRLYDRISADPRHDAVEIREACAVPGRAFARWAMASVGEHGDADIPLTATPAGVARGGAWKAPSADQESVLDSLRALTRG